MPLDAAGEAASGLAGDAVEAGREAADAVGERGRRVAAARSRASSTRRPSLSAEPPARRSGQLRRAGPAATPAPSLQVSAAAKRAMRSQASASVASEAA